MIPFVVMITIINFANELPGIEFSTIGFSKDIGFNQGWIFIRPSLRINN
jgi:hypothetical protein